MMQFSRQVFAALLVFGLASLPLIAAPLRAMAQASIDVPDADAKKRKIEEERTAAMDAAEKAKITGPAHIKLLEIGFLDLPQGEVFVPQPQANAVLRANGNPGSDKTLGLIFSEDDLAPWWAVLDYLPAGYVKDDEAKDWDAEQLLNTIKEGTEASNANRLERGFPAVEVTGWIEKPAYDAQTHRLVWSAMLRPKAAADGHGSVNYNTYALGREGYFSLDLITRPETIEADKAVAKGLLAALSYVPGQSYSDFNASTDHIAEYGIAALIGGVALKKLGILALAAAFFLKFAKVGLIAIVAVGAGISRYFRSRGNRKGPQA